MNWVEEIHIEKLHVDYFVLMRQINLLFNEYEITDFCP